MRRGQHRVLVRRRTPDGHVLEPFTRRDETRRHELAQQGGSRGWRAAACGKIAYQGLDHDVVAGPAVEGILTAAAEQDVVSRAAGEGIVAGASEQDVVAVAAIDGQPDAGPQPKAGMSLARRDPAVPDALPLGFTVKKPSPGRANEP